MSGGIGEVLLSLLSYPVLICSIIVFVASISYLIARRKTNKTIIKIILIITSVIAVAIIAFFIFMVIVSGNSHPEVPPVAGENISESEGEDNITTVMPPPPNTRQPSIIVNDTYYFTTGLSVNVEVSEGDYLGRVNSTVPLSEIPLENGQSNYAAEGAPYAIHEDGIIVLINERWILFETWDDELVRDYLNH